MQNTLVCIKCCDLLDRVDELNEQIRIGKRELKLLKRKIRDHVYFEDETYSSSESEDDIKYDSFKVS